MTDKQTEQRMEIFTLPNVRQRAPEPINPDGVTVRLTKFVWALATENPLWTIKADGWRTFHVLKDGELLGVVGEEWYGSNHALFVRNDRIAQQNERKNAYHTQDVNKAMARVKKMFSPMTLTERMGKARVEADKVIQRQYRGISRDVAQNKDQVRGRMLSFVETQMPQFILWLKSTHDTRALEHLTLLEKAEVDMATIKETQQAFDSKGKHALIVLADGKYIVKVLDIVQLYDDTTLPIDLRGKLGMLKLVEDEQMVTGIGCRVSSEIFVVLHETNEEPK